MTDKYFELNFFINSTLNPCLSSLIEYIYIYKCQQENLQSKCANIIYVCVGGCVSERKRGIEDNTENQIDMCHYKDSFLRSEFLKKQFLS